MPTITHPPFSTLPSMLRRYDQVARRMAYKAKTPAAHRRWREAVLVKIRQLTGFDSFKTCPLRPRITEEIQFDGYCRQRVEIQTERGVVMPLYALIPDNPDAAKGTGSRNERLPAIICAHGHGSGGKISTAGCRDHSPEAAKMIDLYNYDYGIQFARTGFIAFCPDARGFGERNEHLSSQPLTLGGSCQDLNHMAYPLGRTVTGMWAWDLHRLIDYIAGRADCDRDRIGCAGLSGGGLQTLWAAALDDRIKCAVVSGYFYGYKQSLLEQYKNCSCNYVPHLFETINMGDLAALVAPRPLLIETGDQDDLNGRDNLKNVESQIKIARQAYKTLSASDRLAHDIFHGGHRWNGLEALPWMKRWL